MTFLLRILLVFCITTAIPLTCAAGIYKYRDANGRLTFVDDESKIPVQYREDVTSVSEANDAPIAYDPVDEQVNLERLDTEQEETFEEDEEIFEQYQTPIIVEGNRVLVPVNVAMGNRSVDLSLLLDTGATRTVFHRSSLDTLDLPSGKSYKARVAGGGIVRSKKIQFRQLTVGPFTIRKAKAMVINLEGRTVPFDGMLGMDFLKSHPYQIDFENQVINWEVID